jgi:isocitrate dehydrogenase
MNKKNKQIVVVGGLVELDGDEMANIMLRAVRKHLIEPFIKINLKTFDLSLQNRNSTNDKVTD